MKASAGKILQKPCPLFYSNLLVQLLWSLAALFMWTLFVRGVIHRYQNISQILKYILSKTFVFKSKVNYRLYIPEPVTGVKSFSFEPASVDCLGVIEESDSISQLNFVSHTGSSFFYSIKDFRGENVAPYGTYIGRSVLR